MRAVNCRIRAPQLQQKSLSTVVLRASVTLVGSKAYVLCGRALVQPYIREVWTLDISTFTWDYVAFAEDSSSMPSGRSGSSTALVEDKIFLFGGSSFEDTLSDIWRFDLVLKQWTQCGLVHGSLPMPESADHASAYLPARKEVVLISLGGPYTPIAERQILCFDPHKMRLLKPLIKGKPPILCPFASTCSNGNVVYIFGGRLPASNHSNDLNILSVDESGRGYLWSSPKPYYSPAPRQSGTLSYVGGRLLLFGGRDRAGYLDSLDLYETAENSWYPVKRIKSRYRKRAPGFSYSGALMQITGHSAVESGGKVYIITGHISDQANPARTVFVLGAGN